MCASVEPISPNLYGLTPNFALQLEAELEPGAGVFVLQHVRRLRLAQVEVALVPALEVRELVVRRQVGVGLSVALDLRRLVEALPLGARLGVFAVDALAGPRLDDGEHAPVGEIAVVRDGEHIAAGFLLVGLPSTSRGRAGLSLPNGASTV